MMIEAEKNVKNRWMRSIITGAQTPSNTNFLLKVFNIISLFYFERAMTWHKTLAEFE